MQSRALLNGLIGLCLTVLATTPVQAGEISTAEIVSSAVSPACVDYQAVGICAWLFCSYGCTVRTSVKVKHYVPELVVSSYNSTGANPWTDVAAMSPPVSGRAEGGGNMTGRHANARDILRFKNVDAIGHPATSMFSALNNMSGMICASGIFSMNPHFLSTLDTVGWRHALVERLYPQAYIPGMRELGRLGDNWGNIYPRSGFVSQSDDYRGGALAAQRVADLVTRSNSPHVYQPLTPAARDGWWPPLSAVVEGDASTHTWQALAPSLENSCSVWPDRGPLASYGDRTDGSGDYVWALWRPYSCCERRGQVLLVHTGG
ncbi:TIGR03756 family integrating conjugative element protein [Halopseudomonas bauzanensis]|uniref:Integrating conjugative element protein, PFL_4710 family n=1 Tax=Halopseudomonas bauzanensis TaxID=653930 RepID=A0A1I4MFI5_9GAMM|nr:TIGR03756 family integrating conjugative element protein [Halopseudomonas bauzanensis]SES00193.1 integrating conjugative element protein, PFL_4710 family [Halopseudomonas bauzanensis]SFM01783.1 integrating conjugative element protein, PFL_4710 family [Halopseudomonas bauzanensis]